MPQFLRAIRMLCALYKHYVEALKTETHQSPTVLSTPTSPTPNLSPSFSQSGASVRRTGSFGSILDSPNMSQRRGTTGNGGRGGGRLGRRFGHRRSHSQSTNPEGDSPTATRENRSQTLAIALPPPGSPTTTHHLSSPSRKTSLSISDPFEQLEMVWDSLESWFDLLMIEVAKIQAVENCQVEVVSDNHNSSGDHKVEVEVKIENAPETERLPSTKGDGPPRKPQLELPTVQSSRLAAAIVQSAPVERRDAFLTPSSSFDHSSINSVTGSRQESSRKAGCSSMDKRRSWHVERFTTRYLATGGSLSSIPALHRSMSSEASQAGESRYLHIHVVPTMTTQIRFITRLLQVFSMLTLKDWK